MLKAVIDTNVIISAIISTQSPPAQVLDFWKEDKFELITSPAILEEVAEVIFRPIIKKLKKISDEEAQELLLELQDKSTYIIPTTNIQIVEKDPSDDKFINAALEGKANYIVSGDKHFLEIGNYENTRIVTPQVFVEILKSSLTNTL